MLNLTQFRPRYLKILNTLHFQGMFNNITIEYWYNIRYINPNDTINCNFILFYESEQISPVS